jgi:hypothetical protein
MDENLTKKEKKTIIITIIIVFIILSLIFLFGPGKTAREKTKIYKKVNQEKVIAEHPVRLFYLFKK